MLFGECARARPVYLLCDPKGLPPLFPGKCQTTTLAHAGKSHPRYTLKAPPRFALTPESFSSGNPFTVCGGLVAKSCPTLETPWMAAQQAHGISQARVLK